MQIQPWERCKGEPERAWEAFRVYVDQAPPRSLRVVAVMCDVRPSQVGRWAERWNWRDRAAAHDRHKETERRTEQERLLREMADRQIKEATLLQQKALHRLRDMHPAELTPAEAARLLVEGARLEREARRLLKP